MLRQRFGITVFFIKHHGHNHPGIAPGGAAIGIVIPGKTVKRGNDIPIAGGKALCIPHITQPFPEKAARVGIVGAGKAEDLRIARPAQPFVALWAVGRN